MIDGEIGIPDGGGRERTVEVRGEVIERERLRRLWSVADLARIAGVSRRTLNSIPTRGVGHIKLLTLERLLKAFRDHPPTDLADEVLAAVDE